MQKSYNPSEIEGKWYEFWQKKGYFEAKVDKTKEPFTILIPPPNVTGVLHMGHVLNNTLQDILIRYKRMDGYNTLWLPGTDHAGIATQNMVEKQLAKEGKSRFDVGRKGLIEKIWQWKQEKGDIIIQQLKKLGCSCDWSRTRFTMDAGMSDAVKEVFIKLYEKGLIYKGKRIINWCPRCTTALANDEVEHTNEDGFLYNIKYPFADGSGYLIVATTRPETMFGDVGVAVNPLDDRYKSLVGNFLILPIVNKKIPIIADEYVDPDFGSGCVKITPAHDPNDFEMGERHNLQKIVVIDKYGKMNAKAGAEFEGLTGPAARKKVISILQKEALLESSNDYSHAIGRCYRCNTTIEPSLSDQWFVDMKPLAKPAIQKVKSGEIEFQPKRWTKVYLHWMENVRDWCISRQIWWGHRIPAYYCQKCENIIVSKVAPQRCSKCNGTAFRQDEDVLDTWFSSALWPFSTLGWPQNSQDLDYFLPTNVLITAPEIIYLWVARMIMTTLEFKNVIPFDTVLLHGIVRDEKGRKMSKSLGNSPDPLKIIEQVGADALRFAIVYHTPKGNDSYYSHKILETGRNFNNKLWNATRYILSNVNSVPQKYSLELVDKWIYAKFYLVVSSVRENYEKLRFNDVTCTLHDFIWRDFCSWYIELSKERIYSDDLERKSTAEYVLLDILQKSMRLLHPIMPFITEEIFSKVKQFLPKIKAESITLSRFPQNQKEQVDLNIIHDMGLIQECITSIRNMKKQVGLLHSKKVHITIRVAQKAQIDLFRTYQMYLETLVKVEKLDLITKAKKSKKVVTSVVQDIEVFLHLEGVLDISREKEKFQKQAKKLQGELVIISGKLGNEKFLQNAPQNIVKKEKEKFDEIKSKIDKIKKLLNDLE